MTITTRIHFVATWQTGHGHRVDRADFQLGLGPCGKTVVALKPWVDNGGDLRITQVHDDGTSKVFFYQKDQILSRIEIERVGA